MKNELINQIIAMEWEMFQKTQNVGGRAWCQDDKVQFDANRRAQFEIWDEKTLQSYLHDLQEAESTGQNPVTLKYAYMMEYTAPEEYERIRGILPGISEEKESLISEILRLSLKETEEFFEKYL